MIRIMLDMLTDWFPGDVDPVHTGLYLREWDDPRLAAEPDFFDGKRWFCVHEGVQSKLPAFNQHRRWRGLREKAE
jgi:hypothetical protein